MAELGFEPDEIRKLIQLVEESGLSELEVEEEGRLLIIRASAEGVVAEDSVEVRSAEPRKLDRSHPIAIESPMVGVFYRANSPDSAPFVDVGDHVDVGQMIGVIEAMKVFSEIPSEHAGVVAEVVAKSGDLVRQGEVLMFLRPE